MKRPVSLACLVCGLGCLVACSYLYEVTFDVTLHPSLASRAGTVVLQASSDRTVLPHVPGTRREKGVVGVCCAPEPVVEIRAFFDENGNQVHDPGEAVMAYPHNPVKLTGDLRVKLTLAPATDGVSPGGAQVPDAEALAR